MYFDTFLAFCEAHGVKPGTVGRMTGISTATITAWKQGRYTPKIDKLQKIAEYFGIPVEMLMKEYANEQELQSALATPPAKHDDEMARTAVVGFYTDMKTAEMAQELQDNSEMRMLFDAAKDATPEDLKTVRDMLLFLKSQRT